MARTQVSGRMRRVVASVSALALAAIGVGVTAATASAAQPVTPSATVADGSLNWGYKESFRRYVANQTAALAPIGALPVGERITLQAPAVFDTAGTAASTTNVEESKPYQFPVTGGEYESASDVTIETGGGFSFNFPSHFFNITVSNITIEVEGTTATVVADVDSVITGDFGEFTAGEYHVTQVAIATATAAVSSTDGTVTVAGTNVVRTDEQVSGLPQAAGEALDDFSVSAALGTAPVTGTPTITVDKQTAAVGETITVTGTGFDPLANIAGYPPVGSGNPAGVYVVFGKFADTWKPSAGATSAARKVVSQKWAVPEPSYSSVLANYPSTASQLIVLNADGSFTATLTVNTDAATGNYGIYTYAAGGAAANAAQELFIPINVLADGDIEVGVEVPEYEEPAEPAGEFSWAIANANAVNLGTAVQEEGAFVASGNLTAITVTDTRADATRAAWSLNGQASNFLAGSNTFSAANLGWAPQVTSAALTGVTAGGVVAPGASGGLSTSKTLVSAAAAHAKGSVTVEAQLNLAVPLDTPAGNYSSVVTITAVG